MKKQHSLRLVSLKKLSMKSSRAKLALVVAIFALVGVALIISSRAANPNLPGDVNNDNVVNINDLSQLLSAWNQSSTAADFNGDGKVTISDLSILLTNWGKTYTPGPGPNPPNPNPNPNAIGLWSRFEATVPNSKSYGNPYRDVTLNVAYTRPDGSKVNFIGFYAGGSNWKIRFMPDKVGTWSYAATFSDGSPGKTGTFDVTTSTIPGSLSLDEGNPMWFGYKGGGHELIRALHVGDRYFAANWPDSSRKAFLDWAQSQGYNTLSIASHYLNRNASGRGAGWQTPNLWGGSNPNAGEYDKLEAMLNDLSDRRMLVYPFGGFMSKQSNYPKNAGDQSVYIKYTIARLGPYWNIMYNVAGPEPNLDGYLSSGDVGRVGGEIKAADVFGHPISVHNKGGGDPYKDSSWSSFGTMQGPKTTNRSELSSGLLSNHHASKALMAQETLWSGNENHPNYSDTDLRKNAYVINMSAAALVFADNSGNSSSGFSGSMNLSEKKQGRHDIIKKVWDFFETVPFYRMKPTSCSGGYCLGEAGQQYLGYVDSRRSLSIPVTGGTYNVQWINAQNTSDTRPGGTTSNGSNLMPPNEGDDWLVRLTK